MVRNVLHRPGRSSGVLAVVTLLAVMLGAAPAAAGYVPTSTTPTTYQGGQHPAFATPTADKPQSKLWFQDGSWWAVMLDAGGAVRVHELRDRVWHSTGVLVDERSNSTADALWDGTFLHVASRTSSGTIRAIRLSYDRTQRTYQMVPGYPVAIAQGGSESVTLDRDSRGRLWATWTQGSAVWVATTAPGAGSWAAPFRPPVGDTAVSADDISSVIAFGGRIGVMWSDQSSSAFRFAVHSDAAEPTAGWVVETPLAGTRMADDHINLKTLVADDAGRVYAAIKTSQGDGADGSGSPSIAVLSRVGGQWQTAVAHTVGEKLTRPVLILDTTGNRLFLFSSTESGGKVYFKSAPLADVQFANGPGAVFMSWPGASINNATSTKDPVSAVSGLVLLASDEDTRTYYHAELGLGSAAPADTTPPSVPADVSAAAVSPSHVDVTWRASSDDTGVAGYRVLRDGAVAATVTGTSFSDTGLAAAREYRYAVQAFDAAGNASAASAQVSVSTPAAPPPPPPSGTGIALVGASAAGNAGTAGVTVARPTGTAAGHVLVASVDARGGPSITPPAGWSLVRYDQSGTTVRKATYVKVAATAEPNSYAFSLSRAEGASAVVAAYSGVSTTSPVEAVAGQANASSTSLVAPSITTTSPGARLLALFGVARAGDVTAPAGTVERAEASATATYVTTGHLADATLSGTGATGSRTATVRAAGVSIGQLVSLRPGGDGGQQPPPGPDNTAPAAPTGVLATPVSSSRVDLSWSASTDDVGVTGYQVLRDGALVASPTAASASDTGLVADREYRYVVHAVDEAGNRSAASEPVQVRTPSELPAEPSGTIGLVGATAAGNAGESGVTVPRPDAVAGGHVLVASVDARGAPTITPPAGWTRVRYDESSTTLRKSTFVKVAGTGEPASYTFALSRPEGATAVIAAYSGVSTSSPVEAVGGQVNASSTSMQAPSITTTSPGARLVALFGLSRASSITAPAGMVERAEATSTARYIATGHLADAASATAGATGSFTATAGAASVSIGQLVALRPAP